MTILIMQYIPAALLLVLGTLGAARGQGVISKLLARAMDQQPTARQELFRLGLIASVFAETGALFALIEVLMLLRMPPLPLNPLWNFLVTSSAALSIGIPALLCGIYAGKPGAAAIQAAAHNPQHISSVRAIMLVGLSFLQAPLIFGFLIALLINNIIPTITNPLDALPILVGGCIFAFGSIGPIIGLSTFATAASESAGTHPTANTRLFRFAIISQTVIETPMLFTFLVSIYTLITPLKPAVFMVQSALLAGIPLCLGLSSLGVGISSGKISAAVCRQLGPYPEQALLVTRTGLLAQLLLDTLFIYGLIISIMLLLHI